MEDWEVVITRLLMALLAGGVIGWNRERAHKPAGMRTHMLISLGAALFVMTSMAHGSSDSESRAIQGVATGVGFLGAGEIVQRNIGGKKVPRNLTSAAAVWVAASAGAAAGAGLWKLIFSATVLTLVTLVVVKKVERRGASPSQDVEP